MDRQRGRGLPPRVSGVGSHDKAIRYWLYTSLHYDNGQVDQRSPPSTRQKKKGRWDGKKWTGVALPITKGKVLERLLPAHECKQYIRLHLDFAAFLFQFPHTSSMPLLDVTTVTDTGTVAVLQFQCTRKLALSCPIGPMCWSRVRAAVFFSNISVGEMAAGLFICTFSLHAKN